MPSAQQQQIGIITQARMTSTRLPGKILKEINHKSLLQYHTDRLKKTGLDLVIATTVNKSDDIIADWSQLNGIGCYRGSEDNVLSRFHEAASAFGFDIIIRVTSDCPLIDPHLIRNSVEKYLKLNNQNLYMSNVLIRTFSRGFDFEIFGFNLLDQAFKKASSVSDLEHVTPYIWNNRSGEVQVYDIKQDTNNSRFRITVDTPEDFELIRELVEKYNADTLAYPEIENILIKHPGLVAMNAHIEQKKV